MTARRYRRRVFLGYNNSMNWQKYGKRAAMAAVYVANGLIALSYALIIYTNSSLLSTVVNAKALSELYILGSLFTLFIFLNSARIVRSFGMYRFLLVTTVLEGSAIYGLSVAHSALFIVIFFLIHQTTIVMVSLALDVYLEQLIVDETHTGRLRSLYLTVSNIATMIAPLILSFILIGNIYRPVYALAAIFIIPLLLIIVTVISGIHVPPPAQYSVWGTLRDFFRDKDLLFVSGAHLYLQVFYAFMVVYTPIYLHEFIGFSWGTLGIMFTIMLVPFVLFEIPIGKIADTVYGEKEFMIAGLLIMAVTLFLSPLITTASFVAWTIVLFTSRIGASFLEVTTESYFFKHVRGENEDTISVFRSLHAFGYIFASAISIISLIFIPFRFLFTIFGVLALVGVLAARKITDTR